MPIGDLLAQISGGDEGSAPSPTQSLPRSNTLPKRKADDDPRSNISKAPRVTTLSSTVAPRTTQSPTSSTRPNFPSRPLDRPTPSQRPSNPINGSGKPTVLSSRPMNGGNRVSKPAAPSRPSPGPSSAPPAARGIPPKKGSFAEILARAQKAQASMGQVGKIQHKKVEGGTMKKVKDEPPAKVDPRAAKNLKQRPGPPTGYTGTAKPGQRNGTPVSGAGKDPRTGRPLPPAKPERGRMTGSKGPGGRAAPPEEEPKKVKKAVAATTGYTGTARPRPGGDAPKKKETPRGGALLSAPRAPRPSHSKSRFEDDYDEDMDDFIDYDDEDDDGGGPRYDYASDASSDMEAGMDDIDVEERRAEVIARREDIEEERLERKLKADKEARKRSALETLRAGRRR